MTTETSKLQVSTAPALVIPKGFVQITARTRATKGKEIPADQRSRSILIPELTPDVSSKYATLVVSALMEVARDQLAAAWANDANLREVDAASYTENALLLYAAREAESKKLNGASILAWFDQSLLGAYIKEQKYSDAQVKKFRAELENIAAPVLSLYNEEKALKRIALLGKFDEDTEHEVCASMIRRLSNYVAQLQKQREELGSIEDIEL